MTTSNPQPSFTAAQLRQEVLQTIADYKLQLVYWQKILEITPQLEGKKIGKRVCDSIPKLLGENASLREGIVMWELRIQDASLRHGEFKFDICYPLGKFYNLPNYGMWLRDNLLRHNEGCTARTAKDIPLLEAKLLEIDALVAEHDAIFAQISAFNRKFEGLSTYHHLSINVEVTKLS